MPSIVPRLLRVAAALLAVSTLYPASAETLIKMATLVPKGSAWHQLLQEMAEDWGKLSGGQVTLRIYPGGIAGDDADVVRKMRLRTIGAGLITSTGMESIDRSVMALQIPLAIADFSEFDCVLARVTPMIEKEFAAKGFVVLGWTDGGFAHFFAKSAVRVPEDLKAQKLFVWAGDDMLVELWKNAGYNPVPLPSTEISTALQTGLVTALASPPQAAVLLQWYREADYMTKINWGVLVGGLVVSKESWEQVPDAVRPALEDSARRTMARMTALTRESQVRDVEAMAKRGLHVVELDAAALGKWRTLVEGIYPTLRGKFIPEEAFDAGMSARDACRDHAGKAPSR